MTGGAEGFADHFSAVADGYARSRPDYPTALIGLLADAAPTRALALDAGCGTGQLSVALAPHFGQVVATDASARQVAAAMPYPRIVYRVARAQDSGLDDRSVDLVTAAQAAHWFDLPAFYAEVRRIARPGACVALIGYGAPRIDDAAPDSVLRDFHDQTLARWWPPERAHVVAGYSTLPFPFPPIAAPAFAIERRWHMAALLDYVATWSALRVAGEAAEAAFGAFAEALAASWPAGGDACTVTWPIALRIGRID